ncbi:iron-containing alcohol dehydrogenase [Clostridium intestinale]|uniref:Iron-containing alcohol dehydrogenase n=2 Tax=Clostridium intestinale TaxID=36845 RepID=U2NMT5_9CLOT|nr:iron-containing alcohol dehydrogenase [Clostridium intestinale]ERK30473.1 iron-containing alcohol dehydrogenase [Clostridium intestinale URNW]QLY81354.1 iron-containing alcohol dehydrogenase [Clostridium intestinale]
MQDFNFYTPTQVVFGKKGEDKVGELVKALNCKKVLVHFGGNSAKKSGLLDRVFDSLTQSGIDYVSLGGVVPNPRLSKVYEGIDLCKKENVDFILAIGGGSVIDSAKAIGYGMANDCDVWDFYMKKAIPTGCLPIGTILTLSAAGSEMSNSSVITNEEGWLKRGCNSDYCRPKFAIMNPELTYTLPPYQTASGSTDILMHTMERYFTQGGTMELTDGISEALMRTVINNSKILMKDPTNYEARAEVMWAGSLSHNGLTGCGSIGDWACHQLEHELGGMFDVAHGAGLAAVWGSWARYVYKANVARFAQFAVNVLGVPNDFSDQEKTALAGIEAMEAYYKSIDMPISIKELGVELNDDQIKELAYKCSFQNTRTVGGVKALNTEDMIEIYKMAR